MYRSKNSLQLRPVSTPATEPQPDGAIPPGFGSFLWQALGPGAKTNKETALCQPNINQKKIA
jgi:hypothetical protein